MTKIDIFSGFLGAGKTTLIKKLITEAYKGEKLVLIENEFGEIGVDGGFLKEAGIQINEMNSGCICCSLVGDFSEALGKVIADYAPDRILIEPSGVGKLSDVIKAVEGLGDKVCVNCVTTVADASKCKMYMKNFGEFFNNQIENAKTVILSRTTGMDEAKLEKCVELIREKNSDAVIITTPWEDLDGTKILEAMETSPSLDDILRQLEHDAHEHHHDHDHHHDHEHHHHDHDDHDEHDEHCTCGCHDHDHEHDHEHHDHDHEHYHDHEHHHEHDHHDHHHEHGEHCCCGHDHDHHHHHHHADEVFESCGAETAKIFTEQAITEALTKLSNVGEYGFVLRAKGIVNGGDGWIHFDYTPGEINVRKGAADVTGRICIIGSGIDKHEVMELFGL